jgi:Zn-dependent peptidase ImmA (M78 family)/transcriptional regulator with XRE-family HTH domain
MSVPSEIFSGARLQLAREFKGLTQKQLGEEVTASHSLISFYEAGKRKDPTSDLVEAMGIVLGFEPAFFYGKLEDVFQEGECSFRHKRKATGRLKDQVRARATLGGMVIARLRKLFRFPNLNVPELSASNNDEIEKAAERCRAHWGLGLDGPILQMSRVVEHAGIVILRNTIQTTDIDAFSRTGPTTVIFLNQKIPSTSRWTFDLAHECGHLVLHRGIATGGIETERAADRFASAFLMPRRAFSREFNSAPWSFNHVFDLKKRWQASAAAIVHRAYDLGLLSAVEYRRAFQYMSLKGWRSKGEPFEPTNFQQPEVMDNALNGLGTRVQLTREALCAELYFKPETFTEITGLPINTGAKNKVEPLPFKRR